MFEFVSVFVMGAVISGGLIIAIGSQNAFLLKTGLSVCSGDRLLYRRYSTYWCGRIWRWRALFD